MNKYIIKKTLIIKHKIYLIIFYTSVITIFIISVLSTSRNLLADLYYQKYINAKNKSNITLQSEYITKSLTLNQKNPEYLFDFGTAFYEANIEDYAYTGVDSNLMINNNEKKLFFNNFLKEEISFFKKYKNIDNPKLIPIIAYEEYIRHNPLNGEVYLKLGLTYLTFEHTENINLLFKMATLTEPQNISHHYTIGLYYLWEQNLDKALEEFRAVSQISNLTGEFSSNYFHNILNHAYGFNTEYNFLAKINPTSYKAFLALANFLRIKNQWTDSKKAFYRAIKLAPLDNKNDIIYKFTTASMANKDWDEIGKIEKKYKNYISSDKDFYISFNILLARSFISQKKYVESLRKAELVRNLDPSDYQAYYYIGLALLNLGKKAEGLYYLDKATKLSPDNIYLHRMLALAYESTTQINKALNEWQVILQLTKANEKYKKIYSEAFERIIKLRTKLRRMK